VSEGIVNAMSIDVEEWFHILEVADAPLPAQWSGLDARVERNTERLLELLSDAGAGCTCFVLGWVAERHPRLVRRIADAGFEIASHGYAHELVRAIGPSRFRADVQRSIAAIGDACGRRPCGYRAPGFSIDEETTCWAFDILGELGMRFDSSIVPGRAGHGGVRAAEPLPHALPLRGGGTILEFPISVTSLAGARLPYCGGGYLRLFPYPFVRSRIAATNRRGEPAMVYVHPRDIDPDQPRIAMPLHRRFRSYVNLGTTFEKLRRLLRDFRFGSVSESLDGVLGPSRATAPCQGAGS
jgi:polysaccharide deacetylase family protein (PEP-CTERM system associated)